MKVQACSFLNPMPVTKGLVKNRQNSAWWDRKVYYYGINSLSDAEKRYCVKRKELLAAIDLFRLLIRLTLCSTYRSSISKATELKYQFKPDLPKRLVVYHVAAWGTLHEELNHADQGNMIAAARKWYWWQNQHRDAVNYCDNYERCFSFKSHSEAGKAPLQSIINRFPNEIDGINLTGPLPVTKSGNQYALFMVDLFLNGAKPFLLRKWMQPR